MALTKEEEKLTKSEILDIIHRLECEKGRGEETRYYRLLLKYKYAQEKAKMAKMVKKNLGIERVSGTFTREDTAKALGMTERQVMTVEKRALKKLKMPNIGRKIKQGMYE